jgi:plasmid stability protein
MANLSIRNLLDPHLKQQAAVRARLHDRSMEAEVRELLRQALDNPGFSSVSSTAPDLQPTESPAGTTTTDVHPA